MPHLDLKHVISDLAVRRSELQALQRLAFAAATAPDLETLLRTGGPELTQAFAADGFGIYLLEGPRGLMAAWTIGVDDRMVELHSQVPKEGTITAHVASDGMPRSWLSEEYPDGAREIMMRSDWRAVASAPLRVRDRIIGCLNVGFKHPCRLSEAQLQLLTVMAAHIAAAIEGHKLFTQSRAAGEENARLYEELRTSSAELARLQDQMVVREHLAALGEMTAALAHEVRSPLAVFANALSILSRRVADPPDRELLATMHHELQRMNQLVDVLLDFARPPAALFEATDVVALVTEAAEAARTQAAQRDIRVLTDIAPDLPPVAMDLRLMRQALLNVVLNAIQASRAPDEVRIRVRATEGGGVSFEIEDQGSGMPPEVQARIFEPFFTTRQTGTGLGLALVRRIVEQHQGRIEVTSQPGVGTRVRIELPAVV